VKLLKDLLPEHVKRLVRKEAVDLPPIQFHVPPAHHQTVTKSDSQKQNFYHNSKADFSKLTKMKNFEVTQDFIDYIKSLENPHFVGYNKSSKLWTPHKSPEGGLPTIGYGHKMTSSEVNSMSGGITDADAEKLLQNDLLTASRAVKSYVSSHFGDIDLTNEQMEMLTEFAFNLGSLNKFPKFTEAVVKNNWEVANREYKRTYVDSSGTRKELTNRNAAFFDRFLSNKVA
jgi:GH24 family phage-related lysozyme (muramidase)